METTKKFLVLLVAFFSLGSCNKNSPQTTTNEEVITDPIIIQLNTTESTIAESDKDFAMNFFYQVYDKNAKSENKENFMISPFSLSTALSMVWNGANGTTKTAIQNALGYGNYNTVDLNGYYKKMKEALLATDPSVKLAIANSIWYREGILVNDDFLQINKSWFNARVEALDFKLPSAVTTINKWCSDNTNGLIKQIITEIKPSDLMFLLNALYFKGNWAEGFTFKESNTKIVSFTKENGSSVTVNMMNNTTRMLYYTDATLTAVNLPYGNGAFSMMLMLPQDNVTMSQMAAKLKTPSYWHNLMNSRTVNRVILQIPKFKLEYEGDLNDVLKQMGMSVAFNPDLADFSKIFPSLQTYISTVKQVTFINVDETGTEAAAVTSIGMAATSAAPLVTFTANRPFVYAICENSTGCILFMGLTGNPK